MRWAAAVVALALVVEAGCAHHQFQAFPPNMSQLERVAAFNRLHATHELTHTSCSGRGGCSTSQTMLLADGREVRFIEDVAPLVLPDSPTARAGRARVRAYDRVLRWLLLGTITTVVGTAMIVSGGGVFESGTVIKVGVVVGLTGFGMLAIGGGVNGRRMGVAQREGIHHYNDDLARSLNVCVTALGVVPCEALAPPPPVQPAPRESLPPGKIASAAASGAH